MDKTEIPSEVKKVWVKPQIVERVALSSASVTKNFGAIEAVIFGAHYGPRSS